ncbi:MAG: 2-hydroxymuconate tautomerase family protein [Sphingomonas sp.]|uniref:2-hydroxymuconate tautomerase family protein n=1 Tax=Sphingomonas sp. TaxID=28214 RepID=UPI0025CEC24D|nr:2-hydroxymuconate tautomerase family protein [Sphingomonas sp.]MBX3563577.1 2-hydroxymuconate tautomerase family protein [Sphingomonas sp.]
MPIIRAEIVAGRSWEKRQELMRKLAEAAAEALDAPLATVRVLVTEIEPHHWSVGGEPKALPDADPANA